MATLTVLEERIAVTTQADAERAQHAARALAVSAGFSPLTREGVALATMELATNLLRYAVAGAITLRRCDGTLGAGIEIESRDAGPGISAIERALSEGYSTGGGLGEGLPLVRRTMDQFSIESSDAGTLIIARKWFRTRS